ncbi:hypothetical protein CN184_24640 [Sinorhizobium medicae]|uniref:hypothetical protein n=1 Tax=Sinorhizobium medicae TaxID=110321 RepID=UPI000FD2FE06|nr:hypothetical protein [Sinorhizobium medicae]RVJ18092.1 hypothetical protein CN184_24640 [Sinorhizobium medicae]
MGKLRAAEKIAQCLDDCLVEIRYLANAYERRVLAVQREPDRDTALDRLLGLRRELIERFGGGP